MKQKNILKLTAATIYDQMFLGFITDTSRKVTESALDGAVGEVVDIETENIDGSTATWTTRVVK